MHQRDTFGGLYDNQVEPRQLDTSEFIGCHFDGPPIACKRGLRVASLIRVSSLAAALMAHQ